MRGGALDLEERNFLEIDYAAPTARLAIAPSFGPYEPAEMEGEDVVAFVDSSTGRVLR